MFQYYIWDFDGTLFNSYPHMARSFQRALAELDIEETTDEIMVYMKDSVTACIEHFLKKYNVEANLRQLYKKYERGGDDASVKPYPHLEDVLRRIVGRGGQNFVYTHRGKDALDYIAAFGMDSLFSDAITSENKFAHKPAPDAINHLVQKHGMDRKAVIMIGDRDIDVISGWNAGVSACLFDPDNYFPNFKVEYRVKSMPELMETLLK